MFYILQLELWNTRINPKFCPHFRLKFSRSELILNWQVIIFCIKKYNADIKNMYFTLRAETWCGNRKIQNEPRH